MMCNTRLSLSLGSSITPPHQHNKKGKLSTNDDNQELTLCLSTSSEFTNNCDNRINPQLLGGVNSSVSSFSHTSSVKRERDASSFEEEIENLETKKIVLTSPKGLVDHDDDDEDVHEYGTRKKLRLTKEQSDVLEESFKEHTTLNSVIHL